MKWLWDWREAAKTPRRTLALLFACGFVAAGSYTYLNVTDRNRLAAVLVGTMIGLVLARVGARCMREAGDPERAAAMAAKAAKHIVVSALVVLAAFGVGYATRSAHVFLVLLISGWVIAAGVAALLERRAGRR